MLSIILVLAYSNTTIEKADRARPHGKSDQIVRILPGLSSLRVRALLPVTIMTKNCANCGQTNPPDAAFCLNCSTPLGPTVAGTGYQQQSPPHVGGRAPYVGAPPQQYQNPPPTGSTGSASGRAIASAILALVTLILCCGPFTGIPAAILGWLELDAIKGGKAPEAGRIWAQIGLWGGIAATIISSVAVLFFMLLGSLPMGMGY